MDKDKLKVYAVEIMLLIISFALFEFNIISKKKIAIILILALIIICLTLKKQKSEATYKKQVTTIMIILGITYLASFYFMGLYFGYYKASVTLGIWSIQNYLLPTIAIIIALEYIRNILLKQNAKTKLVTFIVMCLIDIAAFGNIHRVTSLEDILILIGLTIFSSISSNLLYQYVSINYGALPIIIYRIIITIYAYIIPFIPDVDTFLRTILRILYPYIVYQILEYMYAKQKIVISQKNKKMDIIIKVVLCIFILLITMLISCRFKYGILILASGSMKEAIDIGDAVIFEQYKEQKLEKGEIIIFNKDDTQIVHRIVDVNEVDGQVRYYTKGDANQNNDEGYILDNQIIGVTKFKIKYIGHPTLWLRRLFK